MPLSPVETALIAEILSADTTVCKNWKLLLSHLDLSSFESDFDESLKNRVPYAVLFLEILQKWNSRCEASMKKLSDLLKSKGHVYTAEKIDAALENRLNLGSFSTAKCTQDSSKLSGIHLAAADGNVEMIRNCLLNGESIDDAGADGWRPIHYIAAGNHLNAAKFLVSLNANISIATVDGAQAHPIHLAAVRGHIEMINFLLQNHCDINQTDVNGWTAMHCCAYYSRFAAAEFLKSKNAKLDSPDFTTAKRQPVHLAAMKGHVKMLQYFLDSGVSVATADAVGFTLIHYCALSNNIRAAEFLKNYNVPLNEPDNVCKKRPIHIAACEGHVDMLKFLLDNGVNVGELDEESWTPMHFCALGDKEVAAAFLLSKGAHINGADTTSCRRHPVHIAAHKGHLGMLMFLIKNGANIYEEDANGWTVFTYCDTYDHPNIREFLKTEVM